MSRARRGAVGAVGLALVLVTGVHFGAGGADMTVRGPLLVVDHLFDVALALALLALCAGVGRAALEAAGVNLGTPIDELVFATTIGAGLVSSAIVLVGLTAGIGPLELTGLGAAAIAAGWRGLRALPSMLAGVWRTLTGQEGTAARLGVGTLALVGFALVVLALAPPTDWDSLTYHLPVPLEWLRAEHITLPDDNVHAPITGLVHALYVPALALGSMATPALLNAAFALLLGVAVFAFARRHFGRAVANRCLWLLWGSAILLLVASTPRVDVTLALYLFLAHAALIRALEDTEQRPWLWLSALMLGFAIRTKLLALPYALALAPLLAWTLVRISRRRWPRAAFLLAGYGALVALGAGPWVLKSLVMTGTPLYPLFSLDLLPPWLASVYGSRHLPSGLVTASQHLGEIRVPFNLRDFFFHPGRLTPEGEGASYYPTPLFALLPLAVLARPRRIVVALLLPALLYTPVLLLWQPYTNLRYLIPILPPLTIGAVVGLELVRQRLRPPRLADVLTAILAGVMMLPAVKALYDHLTTHATLAYAGGRISRAGYVGSWGETGSYFAAAEWVNRHLGPRDRVLMLYESRGLYLRVPTRQDNLQQNWMLLAPFATRSDCLGGFGLTYVLVNDGAIEYYYRRGMNLDALGWGSFSPYAARCLEPEFRSAGVSVYRIRTEAAAAAQRAPATGSVPSAARERSAP